MPMLAVGLALALTLSVTACAKPSSLLGRDNAPEVSAASGPSQVVLKANVRPGATAVGIDRTISVRAVAGTLDRVVLRGPDGTVDGRLSPAGTVWRCDLRPATRYVLESTAQDRAGRPLTETVRFRTRELSLDEQTYPSFVPTEGSTVGIAMPAIIKFDLPVADKATFERRLKVTTEPAQAGSFHWISDREVHWRPRDYWQPGTRVTLSADVGGVPAGNGIYGQLDRTLHFTVGRAQVVKVDADRHRMQVVRDGAVVRDFPITTGKAGFITRSGTKVVMEKFDERRMDSETIGIPRDSAEGYDLDDVQWAMRLTYSGEFIHAAPWSVRSQGRANVSHGCTGMSTADAKWLYDNTLIGDPVEYTGTDRGMTLTNGYGDWNLGFAEYAAGSAL